MLLSPFLVFRIFYINDLQILVNRDVFVLLQTFA